MADNNLSKMQKNLEKAKQKPRTVQLRIVFIKIDDIRTVQEEFSAIVFIRARWREPGLDNCITRELWLKGRPHLHHYHQSAQPPSPPPSPPPPAPSPPSSPSPSLLPSYHSEQAQDGGDRQMALALRERSHPQSCNSSSSNSFYSVPTAPPYQDVQKINWGNFWDPKLDVQNLKSESKPNQWRELELGPQGEVFVLEKRRVKGTFAEQMELAHFPFDIQDLSVLVTSELKEGEIELTEDENDVSLVDLNAFTGDQEWELRPSVWTEPKEMVTTEYTQFAHSKPGVYFRCCATRLAGFFIWNIMLVMSVISAMGFVTFAVNRNLPQNRIQLSFLLVLASVTFKFAASSSVPKISYLTHLDRYILGNMLFTSLIAVWHGVVTLWESRSEFQADLDWWAFVTFIVLYVFIHIVFVLLMMFSGYRRRCILLTREQEYLDKATRLSGKTVSTSKKRMSGFRMRLAKVGFV